MKKLLLFVSLFSVIVLVGAGCSRQAPVSEPIIGQSVASEKEASGERVAFFDDSYGESSTIYLPKDWGYVFSANPSWVTSNKVNTYRIFSGEEKNRLWVYIVPYTPDNENERTQFEKAAKPEIVKTGIRILPSYFIYAEYVTDDEQSRIVFGSIAEKS